MRVVALYDVHGNLPALTVVLAEVDALGVDAIVVGGDVPSGPMPVETLDAIRSRGAWFVRGNADRVLLLRRLDPRSAPCSSTPTREWAPKAATGSSRSTAPYLNSGERASPTPS